VKAGVQPKGGWLQPSGELGKYRQLAPEIPHPLKMLDPSTKVARRESLRALKETRTAAESGDLAKYLSRVADEEAALKVLQSAGLEKGRYAGEAVKELGRRGIIPNLGVRLAFTNKILTVAQQQAANALTGRFAGGVPVEALEPGARELNAGTPEGPEPVEDLDRRWQRDQPVAGTAALRGVDCILAVPGAWVLLVVDRQAQTRLARHLL